MASSLKRATALLALLAATAAQGQSLYCCPDPATGRRVCADSLPEQCRGHAYKVLDRAGNVVREVGPPLTPEQKAQLAAEAKRRKEEEEVLRLQRRKDVALLETYSSVQDIDLARKRSENDLQEAIRQAEAKIEVARKRRKKFEDEAEFYRKKSPPPEVEKGLRDADSEIRAYTTLLDSKKSELNLIRAKYDEDKRRYLELAGGQRQTEASGADSRPR